MFIDFPHPELGLFLFTIRANEMDLENQMTKTLMVRQLVAWERRAPPGDPAVWKPTGE